MSKKKCIYSQQHRNWIVLVSTNIQKVASVRRAKIALRYREVPLALNFLIQLDSTQAEYKKIGSNFTHQFDQQPCDK